MLIGMRCSRKIVNIRQIVEGDKDEEDTERHQHREEDGARETKEVAPAVC
jgi:hypothetical protein